MTTFTMEGELSLAPNANLLQAVMGHAEHEPSRALIAVKRDGAFHDVRADEFWQTIRALADGLISLGVEPGDRVALMSATRPEWTYLDYAILAVGAVTVPIYDSSSADQISWIVSDSAARIVIVENNDMGALYESIAPSLTSVEHRFIIEQSGIDQIREHAASAPDGELDRRLASLGPDTLATIIYTSGTTGRPKGCMLTHGNLCWDVLQITAALDGMVTGRDSQLLFLPLAHSYAKILQLLAMELGSKVIFSEGSTHLIEEMPVCQPTYLSAVPRIFERVYTRAHDKAASEGKGRIFDAASSTAIAWSEAKMSGKGPSLGLNLKHAVFDKLVYVKLRHLFGGQLRLANSGGGPLGARLSHFFNGVGIHVYEGYGLTETSPVLTCNSEHAWRIGTVGRPLPGTSIRIADDGEILAKGGQIFSGYWNNAEATAAMFSDGWFTTGDVGTLDAEGYLTITGRKKELIVTSLGKNVAPAPLEDALRAHPLISQAVVLGDRRPFVSALVALDADQLAAWALGSGRDEKNLAALHADPELQAEIQAGVDKANSGVSQSEAIRRWAIVPADFAVETGELTPTLKVKRNVVLERNAELVEGLYADRGSGV